MSVKHPNRNLSSLYCQNLEEDNKPQTKVELSPANPPLFLIKDKFKQMVRERKRLQ